MIVNAGLLAEIEHLKRKVPWPEACAGLTLFARN